MDPFASLIAANVAFVGTHFAMSHPLRGALARALGEKGFSAFYSLMSIAIFVWLIQAFMQVGPGGALLWNGQADAVWVAAGLLTILALAFVFASFKANPATVGASAELAAQEPAGAFTITRHPFMWGVAIWAFSHLLVSPSPRTLVTAGAMGVLALLGAHLQDRKKEALMGAAWQGWESRTSYWPRWGRLGAIGWGVWLSAVIGWLAITWAHIWLGGIPAGIWRWVG